MSLTLRNRGVVSASAGGGGFTPADLPNLNCWLDPSNAAHIWQDTAATTPCTGTDPIGRVDDLSGSGHNATQGTAGDRPVRSTINSLGCMYFPSVDGLNITLSGSPTAITIFAVTRNTADSPGGTVNGLWNMGTHGNATHYPFGDQSIYDGAGSNVRKNTGDPTPDLSLAHVYSVRSHASLWRSYLDGTLHYSTATNTVALQTSAVLGLSAGGTYTYSGRLGEFIVCTGSLSDQEHTDCVDYLMSKWTGPFITDTFTAADGTTLDGATTTTGGKTWTNTRGGWTVQTNKAAPTAVSPPALLTMDPGVADKDIFIDVTPQASSIDGLLLRYIDLSNYWRLDFDVGGDVIALISATAGVETTRGTSGSFTLTAGVTYAVRVVMAGNFITVYIDGTFRLQTNNSTHVATTAMGLIAFNTATRFDNLVVYV